MHCEPCSEAFRLVLPSLGKRRVSGLCTDVGEPVRQRLSIVMERQGVELEAHDRAPARHDDDCECFHCWTGEDQAESLADGGDGRKPHRMPHG